MKAGRSRQENQEEDENGRNEVGRGGRKIKPRSSTGAEEGTWGRRRERKERRREGWGLGRCLRGGGARLGWGLGEAVGGAVLHVLQGSPHLSRCAGLGWRGLLPTQLHVQECSPPSGSRTSTRRPQTRTSALGCNQGVSCLWWSGI